MMHRLKEARMQRGLTQHELARKSGLARSTIAAIEGGNYKSQYTATADALARALDVPIWWLLSEGDDPMPRPITRGRRAKPVAAEATDSSTETETKQ